MKAAGVLAASIALFMGLVSTPKQSQAWTVIVGGQTSGYLSPCGCVKPMSGGIKRRFNLQDSLRGPNSLVLETGDLVKGISRQDIIKGETLAEALKAAKVDAIHFGPNDWKLDSGVLASFHRLSGEKVVSTEPKELGGELINQLIDKGPFLVGTAESATGFASQVAIQKLIDDAKASELAPILMANVSESEAQSIANANPAIKLIIHQSQGNPKSSMVTVGDTAIVSPGERGRHVIRLTWNGVKFEGYELFDLGPNIKDDPHTSDLFKRYQSRVRDEKLIDMIPRTSSLEFSSSESCRPCHEKEFNIWKNSDHAHAYETLETSGDESDPECVGCHVVGLDSVKGFQTKQKTPQLKDVGCESCHGAGALHVKDPKIPIGRSGSADCGKCHNLEHSPNFVFGDKWPLIKH